MTRPSRDRAAHPSAPRLVLRQIGIGLLAAGMLTGCASGGREIDATTSTELQQAVVQIADPAANGDYASASLALDALEARLGTASQAGLVEAARTTEIQAAIDAVRADLAALTASATPAPETSTPAPGPATGTGTETTSSPAPEPDATKGKKDETPGAGKGNDKDDDDEDD